MAENIDLSVPHLAANGMAVTATLLGGSGAGYGPGSGGTGVTFGHCAPLDPGATASYTANAVVSCVISGSTITWTLTNAVPAGNQLVYTAGGGTITDGGGNSLTVATNSVCYSYSEVLLTYGGATDVNSSLVFIPAGTMDDFYAARDNAASEVVDVLVQGDSVTEGTTAHTWVDRVRAASELAGYKDGGRGVGNKNDTDALSGEGMKIFQDAGRVGFAESLNGTMITSDFSSSVANDAITLQGYGNKVRLHLAMDNGWCSAFTIVVDGGSPVTFDPLAASNPSPAGTTLTHNGGPTLGTAAVIAGYTGMSLQIDGLSGTRASPVLHTVKVTNLGGTTYLPPKIALLFFFGGGVGPGDPTEYFYVVTQVVGGGETIRSDSVAHTSPSVSPKLYFNTASGTYNIYRGTSSSGPFTFRGQVAGSTFFDDGGGDETPSSANPPSVSTAGRDTGKPTVVMTPEFSYSVGIVYNKWAVATTTYSHWLGNPSGTDNWREHVPLGLVPGNSSGHDYTQPKGVGAPYRSPILAMGAHSINGFSDGRTGTSLPTKYANWFVRYVLDLVGITPVVIIPSLTRGFDGARGGSMVAALKNVAIRAGVPYFNFDQALTDASYPDYTGTGNDPHPNQTGIDAEASSIWTNLLGVPFADTTPPTVTFATDTFGNPIATFSEVVEGIDYTQYFFTGRTTSGVTGSGTTRTFTVTPLPQNGDVFTASYTGGSVLDTIDGASNPLVAFSGKAVTNNVPPPVAPTISNIVVVAGIGSIQIHWDTDVFADSVVNYGTTSSYGNSISQDVSVKVLHHNILINGLNPGTTYHYQVRSNNVSGNDTEADATTTTITLSAQNNLTTAGKKASARRHHGGR